jgi:hypothetical protein
LGDTAVDVFTHSEKVKTLYVLTEMSFYFYDLEEPETFGVSSQILLDAGTDPNKTQKTGTVPGKSGTSETLIYLAHNW